MHCAILFSRKKEFACQRNLPSCSQALATRSTDRCCTTARSWRVSVDTRSAQSAIRRCRPVCAVSRRGSSRRLSFVAAPRPNSCPELRPINTNSSCLSLKVSERQLRRSAPPGFLSLSAAGLLHAGRELVCVFRTRGSGFPRYRRPLGAHRGRKKRMQAARTTAFSCRKRRSFARNRRYTA